MPTHREWAWLTATSLRNLALMRANAPTRSDLQRRMRHASFFILTFAGEPHTPASPAGAQRFGARPNFAEFNLNLPTHREWFEENKKAFPMQGEAFSL